MRRMLKVMRRFGNPLQYSVFLCELSPSEHVELLDAVRDVFHEGEDSFMAVRLGPAGDLTRERFDFLGVRPRAADPEDDAFIV